MLELLGLFIIVFFVVACLLSTFVFCFWFVYLLDAMRRKWKFYKNALRCLQQEDFDSLQQILVYSSQTEFVKNVFLFIINIIEWLILILSCTAHLIKIAITVVKCEHQNGTNSLTNSSRYVSNLTCVFMNYGTISTPFLTTILITIADNCVVLAVALIGCLCMYLASRFSQCSWISSYCIPHIISIFIPYLAVLQIIASFCYLHIIAKALFLLLLTVSTVFTVRQYRKLLMVINWTIVDMRVSGNGLLLERQVRMKRTFARLFLCLLMGALILLSSQYLEFSLMICEIMFRSYSSSFVDISFCGDFYIPFPEIRNLFPISFYIVNHILPITGSILFYTPYLGYGICTMFVIVLRLFTGKSGYRTHFNYDLYAPFI